MKTRYLTAVIPLLILMFSSVAYASLDVVVSVKNAEIMPLEDQMITATANERGESGCYWFFSQLMERLG